MNRRRFRNALAAALVMTGVAVLIGCIPVPVFRPGGGRPRPEERIGQKSSDKPIRLGRSTREEVLALLKHQRVGVTDSSDIYQYNITTITWLVPLCFTAVPETGARYLRLDYGPDGVLRRYKVFSSLEAARANR